MSIDTYLSIKLLPSSLTTWIARSCEVTIDAICYFRHMKSWQLFYHFWRNVFIITFLLSYLFSIHDDGLFVAKVSRNQIDLIHLIRLIWKEKEIIIWFFIKTYQRRKILASVINQILPLLTFRIEYGWYILYKKSHYLDTLGFYAYI